MNKIDELLAKAVYSENEVKRLRLLGDRIGAFAMQNFALSYLEEAMEIEQKEKSNV